MGPLCYESQSLHCVPEPKIACASAVGGGMCEQCNKDVTNVTNVWQKCNITFSSVLKLSERRMSTREKLDASFKYCQLNIAATWGI